jgi:hypothetical protein
MPYVISGHFAWDDAQIPRTVLPVRLRQDRSTIGFERRYNSAPIRGQPRAQLGLKPAGRGD